MEKMHTFGGCDYFLMATKNTGIIEYCKTSKEARGSYSFSEAQNAGLIRNWAFLPIEIRNYCGSY